MRASTRAATSASDGIVDPVFVLTSIIIYLLLMPGTGIEDKYAPHDTTIFCRADMNDIFNIMTLSDIVNTRCYNARYER